VRIKKEKNSWIGLGSPNLLGKCVDKRGALVDLQELRDLLGRPRARVQVRVLPALHGGLAGRVDEARDDLRTIVKKWCFVEMRKIFAV
jgi:hypothetical protein